MCNIGPARSIKIMGPRGTALADRAQFGCIANCGEVPFKRGRNRVGSPASGMGGARSEYVFAERVDWS